MGQITVIFGLGELLASLVKATLSYVPLPAFFIADVNQMVNPGLSLGA